MALTFPRHDGPETEAQRPADEFSKHQPHRIAYQRMTQTANIFMLTTALRRLFTPPCERRQRARARSTGISRAGSGAQGCALEPSERRAAQQSAKMDWFTLAMPQSGRRRREPNWTFLH